MSRAFLYMAFFSDILKRFAKKREKRVAAFIDGFNIYHYVEKNPNLRGYKWVDYWALSQRFLPAKSRLISVHYFSAYAKWKPDKVRRHNIYIRALRETGVEPVLGRFKHVVKTIVKYNAQSRHRFRVTDPKNPKKTIVIPGDLIRGYALEEKKTDVNIASYILSAAHRDKFDIALLFSGDTDFEPVLESIRNDYPSKRLIIVVINKFQSVPGSILAIAGKNNCRTLEESDIKNCQLPQTITTRKGTKITKPIEWT